MRLSALLFFVGAPFAFAAGIDNAVTEQIAPGSYRISFQPAADSGNIEVFASSSADRIDTAKPLTVTRTSPVVVAFASEKRVYFHLKPASGSVRVVSTRGIPLEGGINFRDLGGYRTTDGRYLKWGTVFRSAKLDRLTEKDFTYLNALGLKLVCDFRIETERNVALTKWQGANAPEILFNPIDTVNGPNRTRQALAAARAAATPPAAQGGNPGVSSPAVAPQAQGAGMRGAGAGGSAPAAVAGTAPGAAPGTGRGGGAGGGLSGTYAWMATEGAPEFGLLMRRIANGDVPTVFHCQEGRGRTGLFAALLLLAVGVPRETVMEDFMLTNEYLLSDAALERMINNDPNRKGPPQTVEGLRRSLAVSPDNLNASLKAIDDKYPSFDAYLREGLKLTPAEIASLRTRLLQP